MEYYIGVNIDKVSSLLIEQIRRGLCFDCDEETEMNCTNCNISATNITKNFLERLPDIRLKLSKDVEAGYNGDPAAKGYGEVIFCYPVIARTSHRAVAPG